MKKQELGIVGSTDCTALFKIIFSRRGYENVDN